MPSGYLFFISIVGLIGCSATGTPFPLHQAIVNDCASQVAAESGYRIVEVDGKAAPRARSNVVAVVPFVLVEPGEREFTLDPRGEGNLPRVKAKATVVAGRRYVVKKDGESVVIAEEVME